jgi:hypothetical protein
MHWQAYSPGFNCDELMLTGTQEVIQAEARTLPVRFWLAAAESVLTLSESTSGAKIAGRFGTDWNDLMPLIEISLSRISQVSTFQTSRVPRWKRRLDSFKRAVTL